MRRELGSSNRQRPQIAWWSAQRTEEIREISLSDSRLAQAAIAGDG